MPTARANKQYYKNHKFCSPNGAINLGSLHLDDSAILKGNGNEITPLVTSLPLMHACIHIGVE